MVRFLTITGVHLEEEDKCFAFYDTQKDKIIEFDGNSVFDTIDDFNMSHTDSCGFSKERLDSLIPKSWVDYEKSFNCA